MGNTSALCGSAKCLGRSVPRWMNGFGLWPDFWTGRRWRCCAASSISRARPATRSFSATRTSALVGLTDRSRRPYRHANQLPVQVENCNRPAQARATRAGARPRSGRSCVGYMTTCKPRRSALCTRCSIATAWSAVVGRRRYKAQGTRLSSPRLPNELWCADYKGEFMLADRRYCYPLTISDFASRYLISCEALRPPRKPMPSSCSSALSRSLACLKRCAPITACRSPAPMRCSA